jgi:peptidoglycan/LPS O-acetylase OafA/YrhL
MRAVAILCVVFSHALWNFPQWEGPLVSIIELMGVMGVELFFVLSGFLIGRILFRIYTDADFSFAQFRYFLVRRWFRTLPNYYLVLIINILIVIWIGRDLPESIGRYFLFLQNIFDKMPVFFTESWSLPIEEFAYILAPFLLYLLFLLPLPVSRKKLFLVVTLFIIFFFFGTKIAYNELTSHNTMTLWNRHLKAVTLYRIDAIAYGILAAYIALTSAESWVKYKMLLLKTGIVLFLGLQVAVPLFDMRIDKFPLFWNVLYLPLISISIACLLPWLSLMKQSSKRIAAPVTIISLISYSMYLLHYSIVLQLMRHMVPIEEFSFTSRIFYSVIYISITILLSYILYRIYEKPMMDIRDRPFFRKNKK